MPCWAPGSYLMREFARQIESLEATGLDGASLRCRKLRKETWEVDAGSAAFTLSYVINAQELGVRQPYLDDEFGFFLGVNLFVLIEHAQDRPVAVALELPEGWTTKTSKVDGFIGSALECADFDELADTTFVLGPHGVSAFEALDRAHGFVVVGQTRLELAPLFEKVTRAIETTAAMFGGALPYPRYLFVLLTSERLRGGLEHRDSVGLLYPRTVLRDEEANREFVRLIVHEVFHVWNVKRICTDVLSPPFDYANEAYTRDLWVAEGWTVYYQHLLRRRAGLLDDQGFFDTLGAMIHRFEQTPGRHVQSLEDASFDAWVKFYRRDGHSPNATISYYLKGGLVAFLLDAEIRRRTEHRHSLDDVLADLWERFGRHDLGYPEGSMQQQIEQLIGGDWRAWFDHHIRGLEELDWSAPLSLYGLTLDRHVAPGSSPALGVAMSGKTLRLATVNRGGAAERASLMMGDELAAIDRYRLRSDNLKQLLNSYAVGDEVEVTFWREGLLRSTRLTLEAPAVTSVSVRADESATEAQRQALGSWLEGPSASA